MQPTRKNVLLQVHCIAASKIEWRTNSPATIPTWVSQEKDTILIGTKRNVGPNSTSNPILLSGRDLKATYLSDGNMNGLCCHGAMADMWMVHLSSSTIYGYCARVLTFPSLT